MDKQETEIMNRRMKNLLKEMLDNGDDLLNPEVRNDFLRTGVFNESDIQKMYLMQHDVSMLQFPANLEGIANTV